MCEATKQWLAAAWHLTKLLETVKDSARRADLLVRCAQDLRQVDTSLDNWADSLPKCIANYESAIRLGRNTAEDYSALGEAYLAYGSASGKADQWSLAREALREATQLKPNDAHNYILLGEALAGSRYFPQADAEFQKAQEHGSTGAFARLALVGWLEGDDRGRKQYRDLCLSLNDPTTSGWKAFSLLWPAVLTDAFENDQQTRSEFVRRAKESLDADPTNYFRRNTYGAALYRAGRYQEAITELEAARAAYLAERAIELSQFHDSMIRVPVTRTSDGRAQDCAFLAMANARLGQHNEAWDWYRKLRDAPELSHLSRLRRASNSYGALASELRDVPVPYSTLALELLYAEVLKVLLPEPVPASSGQ